jgi:hypothetical protein
MKIEPPNLDDIYREISKWEVLQESEESGQPEPDDADYLESWRVFQQ